MLHKVLQKSSLGSFYEQNSHSKVFLTQSEKRKFLLASLGLFGTLPLFQFFRTGKHKAPYALIASLRGGPVSELDAINFRNKEMLDDLENRMLKEKKILKLRSVSSKNQTSWVYIFDSKESYWKWDKAITKLMKPARYWPKKFQYFQTDGFLSSKKIQAGYFNLIV